MENSIKIGRPIKSIQRKKLLHYCIYVTIEEKATIDKLIKSSGLSASQFLLTQVIDKPIKTQRRKSWPDSIMPYALAINKFSGMLSLLALKTKDKDMRQATNWIESSEHIKWISKMIMLRVFEDFDFPLLKNSLMKIEENSRLLTWQLDSVLDFQGKNEILAVATRIQKTSKNLLDSFEKHYIDENTQKVFQEYWSSEMDILQEIKKIKAEILKL
jgi:hypothetical protein